MKRFKKLINLPLVIVLAASLCMPVFAGALSEAQDHMNELTNQLSDVNAIIKNLEGLKNDLQAYVQEIDAQLGIIRNKIDDYQKQIDKKNKEIKKMNAEIAEIQAKVDEEYANMKLRIKFMYENSDAKFFDIVFSSENFADMLNKYEYLNELTEYDRGQLDEMQENIDTIKKHKTKIKAQKAEIEELQNDAKAEEDALSAIQAEKQAQMQQYLGEIEEYEEDVAVLQAEIDKQQELIRRLAAETDQGGSGYNGGKMFYPLPLKYQTVTSWYGRRELWGEADFHKGIDIWAPTGTDIYAGAAGTVVISYYSPSAGNWVVIYHGNGIYSEYMHCSKLIAKTGDVVKAGDLIAKVGATGMVTGEHLHFGIIKSQGGLDLSGRTDPTAYLFG